MTDTRELLEKIDELVHGWCDRRALRPLRFALRYYPLRRGSVEDWLELLESLKDVKGACGEDTTEMEKQMLAEIIDSIDDLVHGTSRNPGAADSIADLDNQVQSG